MKLTKCDATGATRLGQHGAAESFTKTRLKDLAACLISKKNNASNMQVHRRLLQATDVR